MFISPAYAQTAGGLFDASSPFVAVIPVFIVFYFLLIRPQQKQQKELRNTLAALKRGDRVITAGGILGTVQKVNDTELEVEIAPSVRVNVLRSTITGLVKPKAANDSKPAAKAS